MHNYFMLLCMTMHTCASVMPLFMYYIPQYTSVYVYVSIYIDSLMRSITSIIINDHTILLIWLTYAAG